MTTEMSERRERLVKLISEEGSVTFSQIKKAFPDVSEMTLRTDLKALDTQKKIVRVHGGARSLQQIVGTDDPLEARQAKHASQKQMIAQKARSIAAPNSTVFLDSGSTTTLLAKEMGSAQCLVFTNSLTCASELAKFPQVSTTMVGGRLNCYSMCLSGSRALEDIAGLSFDTFFMGTTCYQDGVGFTCGSDEEAALKRACIKQAGKVVVLMDSSKVDRRSTFVICSLEDVDVVVSDGNLPQAFGRACANAEVEII